MPWFFSSERDLSLEPHGPRGSRSRPGRWSARRPGRAAAVPASSRSTMYSATPASRLCPKMRREVDQALAGVLEAAVGVHVLDVELPDPAAVGAGSGRPGRARRASGPEQVHFQVHEVAGRSPPVRMSYAGARAAVEAEELEVVVVVAELEPGPLGERAGLVEVVGERAVDGRVADRRRRRSTPKNGCTMYREPTRPRVGERALPGGRVERLRDADVPGGGPEPGGVERGPELRPRCGRRSRRARPGV